MNDFDQIFLFSNRTSKKGYGYFVERKGITRGVHCTNFCNLRLPGQILIPLFVIYNIQIETGLKGLIVVTMPFEYPMDIVPFRYLQFI